MRADDADSDENGSVLYTVQGHKQQQAGKVSTSASDPELPFSIHPQSGHVIVVDSPLALDTYTMVIEASDQSLNPSERRVSMAVVTVESIKSASKLLILFSCSISYRFISL